MIVALFGPTGIGKTSLSIQLAKKFDAEIINVDLISMYKYLNIGSAKILEEEKKGVVHHFIDVLDIYDDFSIYDYQLKARKILDGLIKKNKNVIICGGSGLYLKALLYDYKFSPKKIISDIDIDEKIKILKNNKYDIDYKNTRRVIRAFERYLEGIKEEKSKALYNFIGINLTMDRDTLYHRINQRVDMMFQKGLVLEVENLYKKYPLAKVLHKAIGYKELIMYLENKISLEEAKEKIKQNSRHYAKKQITFAKGQLDFKNFNVLNNALNDELYKYIIDSNR